MAFSVSPQYLPYSQHQLDRIFVEYHEAPVTVRLRLIGPSAQIDLILKLPEHGKFSSKIEFGNLGEPTGHNEGVQLQIRDATFHAFYEFLEAQTLVSWNYYSTDREINAHAIPIWAYIILAKLYGVFDVETAGSVLPPRPLLRTLLTIRPALENITDAHVRQFPDTTPFDAINVLGNILRLGLLQEARWMIDLMLIVIEERKNLAAAIRHFSTTLRSPQVQIPGDYAPQSAVVRCRSMFE